MPNPTATTGDMAVSAAELQSQFWAVRQRTESLAEPLADEDQVVQTMADVSPTKWHRGHTSWFFETFILNAHLDDYQPFDERYNRLLNSYYQGAGPQWERARRGLLSRPTVADIGDYRAHVDRAMQRLFDRGDGAVSTWGPLVEVGLHHERQHQELMITDIKHVLATNPLRPAYRRGRRGPVRTAVDNDGQPDSQPWLQIQGGTHRIGHEGPGFAFDNERPRHPVIVDDYRLRFRPVSCGEYIQFIEDAGYDDPRWWLSEGWRWVEQEQAQSPLYWERRGDRWWQMTLDGMRRVDHTQPICHVNYFEADAFARWSGYRLPTEAEWEIAARRHPVAGNFAETDRLHPASMQGDGDNHHLFGDVWEWTASAYQAYPGFEPWEDTLGEYNGKFMCNQYVLRGGCCATPRALVRPTYRNFFPPHARWQYTGFRLAN